MTPIFKTLLIGGDMAKRAAKRIGEFDYLCGLPLSVVGFVNPNSQENFSLVNCGSKWHDLPIYKNVQCAISNEQSINSVGIYFNAKHVLFWVKEILKYPQIKNVVIFAEDVPERDEREIVALAKKHKVNIVGPSSTGMLIPGQGRLGEIGGDWLNLNLCRLEKPGPVGIITKSGTMSGEMLWVVSQNSPGIAQAVHIGGDAFPATDFVYWLEEFSKNPKIKVVVLSGEVGGDLEERAAQWYRAYNPEQSASWRRVEGSGEKEHLPVQVLKDTVGPMVYPTRQSVMANVPGGRDPSTSLGIKKFKLIAVISGRFLEQMPKGQKFGHAGAKQEESGFGSARHKIEAFKEAGAVVVEFEALGKTLKNERFA